VQEFVYFEACFWLCEVTKTVCFVTCSVAGDLDLGVYKLHGSSTEMCPAVDGGGGGACSCSFAREVLRWCPGVKLSQPKKMRIGSAVQVLEHWFSHLQLLSQQQAVGQPDANDLARFAVVQPCADFIAATLEAVAQAQQEQQLLRRGAAAAGDAPGAVVPPAAAATAVEGGLVVP
jgi:hypothetical protein